MVLVLIEHRVQPENARQIDQICLGGVFQSRLRTILKVEENLLGNFITFQ